MSFRLRPYQSAAIERVRDAIRRRRRRVILAAPTGAGKTTIAAAIIAAGLARDSRALFVAHRRELVLQPRDRLRSVGIEPGLLMAGFRPKAAPVQIASIDTLRARSADYPPADFLIIDEAHRTLARSYLGLLEHYPAAVVIGLTATPYRGDGRGLGEVYDELVEVATYAELVDEGYLVEPTLGPGGPAGVWTVPELPDLEGCAVKGADYDRRELERRCLRSELVGDVAEHYQRHGQGERALVFASGVAHSQAITAAFRARGIEAAHVDGTTPGWRRAQIWERLAAGELRVVSNCDVATEGLDIPAIKTVILARPTLSMRIYLQQCGRGARPWQGRPFSVLDHAGLAVEHGLPQEPREWSLEGRSRRQDAERPLPPAKSCRGCLAVVPTATTTCPACGWAFPAPEPRKGPAERSGRLRPLRADAGPHERWLRVVELWRRHNGRQAVPLKPSWCSREYRKRYGTWPPSDVVLPMLSPDELHRLERFESLKRTARRRGYKRGWVFAQMRESA